MHDYINSPTDLTHKTIKEKQTKTKIQASQLGSSVNINFY